MITWEINSSVDHLLTQVNS